MVRFFSRKILAQNMSAEEAMQIWTKLREAGVSYEVETRGTARSRPFVRMPRTGRTGNMGSARGGYMAGGIPDSWLNGNPTGGTEANLYYTIYVNRKDLDRAKEVCGLS